MRTRGNVVSRDLAVALNDVSSNEQSLDLGRAGTPHHDMVAAVLKMWGAHVHNRDVGLHAWGDAVDLAM